MKQDRVLIYIEGSENGKTSERAYESVYESENKNLFNVLLRSGNYKCLTAFYYKDQTENGEKLKSKEEIQKQVADLISKVNLEQARLPISLDFIIDENGLTDEDLDTAEQGVHDEQK
jgi:hypothetical protein